MAILYIVAYRHYVGGSVLNEQLSLILGHQAVEVARLVETVVASVFVGIVAHGCALGRRIGGHCLLNLPFAYAVGRIAFARTLIAIYTHLPVAMETVYRTFCPVHRYLVVVDTEAIALRVAIGEESALQQFVGRESYSRHNVRRIESSLFHLREIVVGVAVELQNAHLNKGKLAMLPHLCDVEGVLAVGCRLLLGHYLYAHFPSGKVASLYCLEEVATVALPVFCYDVGSLGSGEISDVVNILFLMYIFFILQGYILQKTA